MLKALKPILDIQELDMQMIQLMQLKRERQNELKTLMAVKEDLQSKVKSKEADLMELKKNIRMLEGELNETTTKFKKLESQQHSIKKVEEFNALNHEMAQVERERVAKEQRLSEAFEQLASEEANLKNFAKTLETTTENDQAIETEISDAVRRINEEGIVLKTKRDKLVGHADQEVFRIYERLLCNKKDRVIVPIENRCCSGCHIMLTAQDENLVRKGERLVFCEHCSRIHYWQEGQAVEGTVVAPKTRRRRSPSKV